MIPNRGRNGKQAALDACASLRTQLHATQEALRALVALLDEVGGYMTPEQQDALRSARALLPPAPPPAGAPELADVAERVLRKVGGR